MLAVYKIQLCINIAREKFLICFSKLVLVKKNHKTVYLMISLILNLKKYIWPYLFYRKKMLFIKVVDIGSTTVNNTIKKVLSFLHYMIEERRFCTTVMLKIPFLRDLKMSQLTDEITLILMFIFCPWIYDARPLCAS